MSLADDYNEEFSGLKFYGYGIEKINRKNNGSSPTQTYFGDLTQLHTSTLNFHLWRVNALTTTTLRQTEFLLRAKNELITAEPSIAQFGLKILNENNVTLPESLFTPSKVEKEPQNFLFVGLLRLLQVPSDHLSDSEWISVCQRYLCDFPELFSDLLDTFGIQKETPVVALSAEHISKNLSFDSPSSFISLTEENEIMSTLMSSSCVSRTSSTGTSRRGKVVTFEGDNQETEFKNFDLKDQLESYVTTEFDRISLNKSENSNELMLQGKRVYNLHVAMMDRPAETKELVRKHEEFFNRVRGCIMSPEKREDFESILYEPREVLDDITWVRLLESMLESAPALQAHFKELVGFQYYEESVESDGEYDEKQLFFHDPTSSDEDNDEPIMYGAGTGPVSFDSLNSVSNSIPATSALSSSLCSAIHISKTDDNEDDSDGSVIYTPLEELFGIWDRIFVHLRENPAIIGGLQKDYPQFFVNLRNSFIHRSDSRSNSLNNFGKLKNADDNSIVNTNCKDTTEIAEYERFKNILLSNREVVSDEVWIDQVHSVLGAKKNLLDQFKEIVAYELEIDEDEINRYSHEAVVQDDSDIGESTQAFQSSKGQKSSIVVPLRDELSILTSSEIEKKHPLFFSQLHQHLRYHGHPPRAFSRFMRILRAPRDYIADDKWLGLLTHSFLGGSRKLRKNFRNLIHASVIVEGIANEIDSDNEEWLGEFIVPYRSPSDIPSTPHAKDENFEEQQAAIDCAQKRMNKAADEFEKRNSQLMEEIRMDLTPVINKQASEKPTKLRPATSVDPFTLLKDHLRVIRNVVNDTDFVVRLEEIMGMGTGNVYTPNGLYSRIAKALGIRQLSINAIETIPVDKPDQSTQIAHPEHVNVRDQLPAVLPALETYVLVRQVIGDPKLFGKILHEFIDLRERQTPKSEPNSSLNVKPMKLTEVLRMLICENVGRDSELMKRFDALVTESYAYKWREEVPPPLGVVAVFGLIHPTIDAALGVGAQKTMATYMSMAGDL
ncbi:hypothetical protein HK096_011525 [Nowakowskiella sp. JEL0078]|nr:hypothetical protein HK096_011525 [Nowakowskiella sp. JEL0078]